MIINLITYNNSTNYGALLQCLCLKDLIEENFNCLVKLNKYHPSKLVYAEKYRPLITKNFNKFLGTAKKNLNVYFWKKHAFKNQFYEDNKDYKESILAYMVVMKFGILKTLIMDMTHISLVQMIKKKKYLMQLVLEGLRILHCHLISNLKF